MTPMTFHLDCGEGLEGRHITATGLRLDGMSDDETHADYSEHTDGKPSYPMVSLTYRVTPALPPSGEGRGIYATVRLDPPLDPAYWDEELAPGAELRTPPGAVASEAAVGPFVLPDITRELTIRLVETTIIALSAGQRDAAHVEPERDLGSIVIGFSTGTPRWEPAGPSV